MNLKHFPSLAALVLGPSVFGADAPKSTFIGLSETAVRNLRIETVTVKERDFESTLFAIGRIEEDPAGRSALSTRIPGRIASIHAIEGDLVEKDQVLARVESLQPGDPPPVIDLLAPRSGVVIRSHVRLGEPVTPERELMDVSDHSTLWAIATIPETQTASVKAGTLARIRIPALGETVRKARLLRFRAEADREAGALRAIFPLDNAGGDLLPGMRVEFSIVTAARKQVMSVPRAAVQGDPANRIVFVKDFELAHSFHKVPVVFGEENDAHVEVLSGLFPGDEVVTRGSYLLAFTNPSSGMSLKEKLDADHGHEHNEDGSEMTPAQREARRKEKEAELQAASGGSTGSATLQTALLWYGAGVTLLAAFLGQRLLARRKKAEPADSTEPAAPGEKPDDEPASDS